jgi:hypothetical protein
MPPTSPKNPDLAPAGAAEQAPREPATHNSFTWFQAINEADLSSVERSVMFAALAFANWRSGRQCRPSQPVWARQASITVRTLYGTLRVLMGKGVLIEESPATFRAPAEYRINLSALRALARDAGSNLQTGSDFQSGKEQQGDRKSFPNGVEGISNDQSQRPEVEQSEGSHSPAKADRKSKPKAPKTPPAVSWPLILAERPDVHRLWSEWQEARRERHRAYSPVASAQSQAERLGAFPPDAVLWRLRQALEGAWQGLQLDTLAADFAQYQARNAQAPTATSAAAVRDHEAILRRVRALPEATRRAAAEAVKRADARFSGWSLANFTNNAPPEFVAELNGALEGVANG